MPDYNQQIKFEEGITYEYPDFSITYLGNKKVKMEQYVHNYFIYQHYKIQWENDEKIIKWTSGTGMLNPIEFSANSKTFSFEPWSGKIIPQ